MLPQVLGWVQGHLDELKVVVEVDKLGQAEVPRLPHENHAGVLGRILFVWGLRSLGSRAQTFGLRV